MKEENPMKCQLNNSEWQIMSYLWKESPRTLMQIVKKMEEEQGWSKSTTNTLIRRMLEKGYVSFEEKNRTREYVPLFSQDEVMQQETKSFVERVFRGNLGLMLNNLMSAEKPTKEEIEELKKILEQAEGE